MNPGKPSHSVLFYEKDSEICEAAAGFIHTGLEAGQSAVMIVAEAHRKHFLPWLVRHGLDENRTGAPRIFMYDAEHCLRNFMVDSQIDATRFHRFIDSIFSPIKGQCRAFGEMVDVLAQSDRFSAAMQLEELWNQEIERRAFPLMCGYDLQSFNNDIQLDHFKAICDTHSHVRHPHALNRVCS